MVITLVVVVVVLTKFWIVSFSDDFCQWLEGSGERAGMCGGRTCTYARLLECICGKWRLIYPREWMSDGLYQWDFLHQKMSLSRVTGMKNFERRRRILAPSLIYATGISSLGHTIFSPSLFFFFFFIVQIIYECILVKNKQKV